MNMSYCRFHNTLQDLQDCAEHMEDDDLSEEEAQCRERLLQLCREIVDEAVFSGRLESAD